MFFHKCIRANSCSIVKAGVSHCKIYLFIFQIKSILEKYALISWNLLKSAFCQKKEQFHIFI